MQRIHDATVANQQTQSVLKLSSQILATLVFCGETRRNDSNEIRVAIGVGDHQQTTFCIQPHGDPALLIMIFILKCQRSFVIKHSLGLSKADTTMLQFICRVLALVELNFE